MTTPGTGGGGPGDVLADEQAAIAAGTAKPCGAACACHGGVVCLRAEHPHDVDNVVVHLGRDEGGQLVQWVHTDEHGPVLTDDQVAEQTAQARRDHTRAWLSGIDLDELRTALAGAHIVSAEGGERANR